MAASMNTRADLVTDAVFHQGLESYGKILIGDKGFEFYNDHHTEDYIQIPWQEVELVMASVYRKGKYIPRYAIQTKTNGVYSFSSKNALRVLKAINQYIPSDKIVRSMTVFQVFKRMFIKQKTA